MMRKETPKYISILRVVLGFLGAYLLISFFLADSEQLGKPLMDFFTTNFLEETGASNAVAGIYLNYRVFDTLFEALMLMVSVMEVINVSFANRYETHFKFTEDELVSKDTSEIVARMMGIVYPFVALIGLYIILNGHVSPGGGFQGGSILATALISRYLVYPNFDIDLALLERLEKILYLFIVIVPVLYVFMQLQPENTLLSNEIYMILMNSLIGFKVFSGLSIIFYRFVFYEGADLHNRRVNQPPNFIKKEVE